MPTEEEKIETARKEGAMEQSLKDIGKMLEEVKIKLDVLGIAVAKIPCAEHRVTIEGIDEKVKTYGSQSLFVWGVLALFIIMCLTAYSKANNVEEKISVLQKDVVTLEKVSYGYNEFIRGGGVK